MTNRSDVKSGQPGGRARSAKAGAALSSGVLGTAMIMGGAAAVLDAGRAPARLPTSSNAHVAQGPVIDTAWTAAQATGTPGAGGAGTNATPGVGVRAAADMGSGKTISVSVAPTSIPANGVSTSKATADVVAGPPYCSPSCPDPDADVTFTSSDPNEKIGAVTNNGDGTYSAVITSSTTAGAVTITATDTYDASAAASAAAAASAVDSTISASTVLTQTPGPAAKISLVPSPASIPANGSATSEATATVTDAFGNPVPGDDVQITSSDPNETISAVTDNGNGTYSATVTASDTVGTATLTATDVSVTPNVTTTALLTQTAVAAATTTTTTPAATTTTTPALAVTGAAVDKEVGAGAGLMALGAALVASLRLRRRRLARSSLER
ncbi:MAG: Ig-like domain-containing protein [Acidimicrobiales bacterium]